MTKSVSAPLLLCLLLAPTLPINARGQSIMDRLKQAAKNKANASANGSTPAASTPAAPATPAAAPVASPAPDAAAAPTATAAPADTSAATPANLTVYQNYDFVPGDSIVFNDDFTTTQDGEFPDQWELQKGQGVVNQQAGRAALLLTEGNYVKVSPRVKSASYLGPIYTIEFDTYIPPNGSYGPMVFLDAADKAVGNIHVNDSEVAYSNGGEGGSDFDLSGSHPAAIRGDNFRGHWRHVAIAVKNGQLKVYVDQYRSLVVPNMHGSFSSIEIDGHTDNTGATAHNVILSQHRADAVKDQLVTMGIDASRLTTKGFGDTKPITSNDTPEGKANNRRVEFVRVTS